MEQQIKEGVKAFERMAADNRGAYIGDAYVTELNQAIDALNHNINHFENFKTGTSQLKGDVAEFWHSGTFNINAKLNDSSNWTNVDRSHKYASADIKSNWMEEYGLKYYKTATASAKAQSISHFQRYSSYKASSGRSDLTFDDFLKEKGIDIGDVMNEPIYKGQVRVIPSDQLKEAIDWLELKIGKEELTRPELAERYRDTLNNLKAKIESPDGISSIELTAEEARHITELAKEGNFDARHQHALSTEELVKLKHVANQGLKAGASAAIITMVLKTAPEIYKCLDELIHSGEISEEQFKKLGFAALSGASEGFVRGFISASIVTSCKSGLCGEALKSASPASVAALTVILYQTMSDSISVVKGDMTRFELTNNLSRNIFVTGCALGVGVLTQALLPALPGAYLLGNFVGSFVGSFVYIAWDKALISFCVVNGYTLFGLVGQDYILPDNILKEIGLDIFEYEEHFVDEYKIDTFDLDEYECDFISIIKRGVIGVHQIGYIQ